MSTATNQQKLFDDCPIAAAVAQMARGSGDDRGAIFTRVEVVEFMLDLLGYSSKRKLFSKRLLEPSFGHGDFLLPTVDRLLASWKRFGNSTEQLRHSIRAVELHRESFAHTKRLVVQRLLDAAIDSDVASELAESWLHQGDFLLWNEEPSFDYVVGNPPYIRIEKIPAALMKEYRRLYKTMFDRADLYVPFIEHSLRLLAPNGQLGFICADRWMKNKYGGPLRSLVESKFHLKFHVDMVGTNAFHSDVIAYPAVTVISHEKSGTTKIAKRPEVTSANLSKLSRLMLDAEDKGRQSTVQSIKGFTNGSAPWLLSDCKALELVKRLELTFPLVEEAGCKIGIGVATGADKVFIGPISDLSVEQSRKLPLATTKDIDTGKVEWRGLGIINPFADDGKLVDLNKYPRLRSYFADREEVLKKRHVARKSPLRWYRTIDRIYPKLAREEKLLIPDIKGSANIVYEDGTLYPHHNLYYITSTEWDLRALQTVLCSGIAQLFVSLYSPRMRGDYLRFQAQHLRRIRIPQWSDVSPTLKKKLKNAGTAGKQADSHELVGQLFNLKESELAALLSVPTQGRGKNAN